MPHRVPFTLAACVCALVCFSASHLCAQSGQQQAEDAAQYVKITQPFANIYKELDPKSDVIKEGQKGEVFPLVAEGNSWYKIQVKEHVGWLEKGAGKVVDDPNQVPIGALTMFVVILLGAVLITVVFIQRQRQSENQ